MNRAETVTRGRVLMHVRGLGQPLWGQDLNRFLKEIRKGTLEISREMLARQGLGVPLNEFCVFKMKSTVMNTYT